MSGITVIFDFDRTIIDGDSDNWVVTRMGLTPLFNELYSTMPWNSLMVCNSCSFTNSNYKKDRMMGELQSQGKTVSDIAECLKRTTLHPQIILAIKSAHNLGCDLMVISDANRYFIETILDHHGVLKCFSHVETNPTYVDGEGRLRILPYHSSHSPPHNCHLCPSNMCKGLVIDKIRALKNGRQRFIYIGDGKGDYCPTLKLREEDHVMPRKGYPLMTRICSAPVVVKAPVHDWTNGDELERILLGLIDEMSAQKIDRNSDT